MTVRLAGETLFLEGDCSAEDAAALLEHLVLRPQTIVDWSGCDSLHTAVFQVLLAVRPPLRGVPRGDFLLAHLGPLLVPALGERDGGIAGR